jgi:methionyl-tRNA formyltransferase
MKNLGATVVFFGNGPVAAASLQGFIDTFGAEALEVVVTKARPSHHKDPAPVEQLANDLGLPVWFANSKQELSELIASKQPVSPVGIIIDYGVIVSSETISYFEKGIINSHFSLLPEWRGADPITYSLLSGQTKTGVSLMLIDEGLDTGPLLSHADYDLDGTETSQSLTDGLVELSNQTISHILPLYLDGSAMPTEQESSPVTHSRKLTKQDGALVFSKTAAELAREVRAFSGWPKSRTVIAGIDCVITESIVNTQQLAIGQVFTTPEKTIRIGCRVGTLEILELQPAGKNKMPTAAFLNGYGHLL